ncbi:MAG: hypothetical protein R6V57_11625, partial [Vicinamibacterales bacterium]
MRIMGWMGAAIVLCAAAVALAACSPGPVEQPPAGQAPPAAPAPAGPAPNVLTPEEAAAGWKLLWDGTSLSGWHTYGKQDVVGWEIVGGELIALGQGGDHAND